MPLELTARPELDWSRVTAVYADGGVVKKNPSPIGGTWACVWTDAAGVPLCEASGGLAAAEVAPLPWVSNNLTEVLALLIGLEQVPKGWAGEAFSDSRNAITALKLAGKVPDHNTDRPKWLPDPVWRRAYCVVRKLGPVRYTLLGGHPTRAELAAGVRKDGKPVSVHNCRCDALCGQEAAKLLAPVTPPAS